MKKVLLVVLFVFININFASAQEAFEDIPENLVFKYSGQSGTFDQMRIYAHDVIKVDGEYLMYYTGVGNGNSTQIGLAKSTDGLDWVRYSQQPVFECGENKLSYCGQGDGWSKYRVGVVSVLHEEDKYKMWYFGNDGGSANAYQLGYAESIDGITWNTLSPEPVYDVEGIGSAILISVIKHENKYRLYFTDSRNQDLFYTESTDGISWTNAPVKIGDGRVHSVFKVGDVFVAIDDQVVAVSGTGTAFDFTSPVASINNNASLDQARVVGFVEGEILRTWRVEYLGNEIWRYGNFGIRHAILDKATLQVAVPPEENSYPLYTQIESPYPSLTETESWADDTYAAGAGYLCGNTIAACGCVISSLVMAGRHAGIETDVLGGEVNPGAMNAYLKEVGGYTKYGALNWLAASAYLGELTSDGRLASRFAAAPSRPAEDEDPMSFIRAAATDGDNAVLAYQNGHFVWVPETTESSDLIVQDPWWYDTLTANDQDGPAGEFVRDYNNAFTDARVISISDELVLLSGKDIELHVTGTAELLFKNAVGDKVGYDDGTIVLDLDRASYGNTEVVSLEGEVTEGSAGKHLLVYEAGEEFTIDVIGTESGEFELEFFTINTLGEVTTFDFTGLTFPGVVTSFTFNLETGEVNETEIDYAQFLLMMESLLVDVTPQEQKFFQKWAEKIFENIETKTVSQALQGIEVFGKLLKAKKVDSPRFRTVLDKLLVQIQ